MTNTRGRTCNKIYLKLSSDRGASRTLFEEHCHAERWSPSWAQRREDAGGLTMHLSRFRGPLIAFFFSVCTACNAGILSSVIRHHDYGGCFVLSALRVARSIHSRFRKSVLVWFPMPLCERSPFSTPETGTRESQRVHRESLKRLDTVFHHIYSSPMA